MRLFLSFALVLVGSIAWAAPPSPVTSLAYHHTGKFLVAGLYNEAVILDQATGNPLQQLPARQRVTAVRFSLDGKLLAIASGEPSKSGPIELFTIDGNGKATTKASFTGHTDVVYALDFSPDGKRLASAGYDRVIRIWDTASPATATPSQVLKDHSDTVYGLAWHAAGKLLASAGADRAVKVWDVATGKRLYTLSDPTDWVYTVAWQPGSNNLAAAGVDKSIRVWQADADAGKLLFSVFAHTAPVTKLVYAADGKTLYSMSEGKNLKRWDTTKMVEQFVFPAQTETMLSLALSPDQKTVAVGRFDGVLQLLETATGKLVSQPLPAKPKPPTVGSISPSQATRGQTVTVTINGNNIGDDAQVESSIPGVIVKPIKGGSLTQRTVELSLPATAPIGLIPLTLKTASTMINLPAFYADRFPVVLDSTGNESSRRGQTVQLPATIVGQISRAGEADYYRFQGKADQEIGVQVITTGAKVSLDPILELTDAAGNVLAEGTTRLGFRLPSAGVYAIGIRDQDFRGGADFRYRLHLGPIPVVTYVKPLGVPRGQRSTVLVGGVNLSAHESTVEVPAAATVGSRVPLTLKGSTEAPLGELSVIVGEFPEVAGNAPIPVPGTANGTIEKPGDTNSWRFTAKKDQPLIVEVNARRIGSPLDSFIEILDSKQQPVGRASLRCVARTFVTFRDHDSNQPNIRIETWNELAMGDYVYVGTELLRIFNLPPNADSDCTFYSVNGQREGQLDTTPGHQTTGNPIYKVEIHPYGTTFPPNGMPVFQLKYRNDDGGGGSLYGKDSRLTFTAPADGEYTVRIGDSRGQGGPNFGYRLTVRPPTPNFTVSFNAINPKVWRGGSIPVSATITRLDGFDGMVKLKLENLPAGFTAPETMIDAGRANVSANVALFADATSTNPPATTPPAKLVATAMIDGKEVRHEVSVGIPNVIDGGDIVTTALAHEVTVKPGQETRMRVRIERKNGFAGRIPLELRGLPYGFRVLDIGLNGILITEKDTERDVIIYAEPWVKPQELPFVVLAKREGKGTEHGAKSVLLKVVAK